MPDVIFTGSAGRLEGRYQPGPEADSPLALILHPHPKAGGTMNNPLVVRMYHIFAKRGFATLRFNFRGVGRSEGEFDAGLGELSDAAAALDWLQTFNTSARATWVAGYSFGAWISMQLLMRRPEVEGFVSLALPANVYDFSFLAPCPSSGLIVHGDNDSAAPKQDVDRVVSKLRLQRDITIEYTIVPGANHFFGDDMERVEGIVNDYLDMRRAGLPQELT